MDKNNLIEQNIELANKLSFLGKRLPSYIDIEDIKSSAYLGLVEAASTFNTIHNIPFQSYAKNRILGSITDYLRFLYKEKACSNEVSSIICDNKTMEEIYYYFLDDRSNKILNLIYYHNYSITETRTIILDKGKNFTTLKENKKVLEERNLDE